MSVFLYFSRFIFNLKKTTQLKPNWAKGYAKRGAALYTLNRMEEAKICFDVAVKLAPNNASSKKEDLNGKKRIYVLSD